MITKEIFNKLPFAEKSRLLNDLIQKRASLSKPTEEQMGGDPEGGWVYDIKIAEDGSVRAYLEGHPEPMRIYPDSRVVMLTAVYKRLLTIIASNFKIKGWFDRIITLIYLKNNFNIITDWFEYIFGLYPALLNEENYSQPTKELRRILTDKMHSGLVDAITLIIEYDTAYRYRFQDIVVELKKTELFKNTRKEILRLLQLAYDRELGQNADPAKWRNLKKMAGIVLFSPKICRIIRNILEDINLEEIRMSKEDIYWTNAYGIYSYRGKSFSERKKENEQKYKVLPRGIEPNPSN